MKRAQFGKQVLITLIFLLVGPAWSQETLPQWAIWQTGNPDVTALNVPAQLEALPSPGLSSRFLVLRLDPTWTPDWKSAAFQLKSLVVAYKSQNPQMKVGVEGAETQLDALLGHELAAYFDGYVYSETPVLPKGDETGKLWLKTQAPSRAVLSTLIDAASLGVELVLFQDLQIGESLKGLLQTVSQTRTGSLDEPPALSGISPEAATFFFDATSGNYHLALLPEPGGETRVSFSLGSGTQVRLIYPQNAPFRSRALAQKTEIVLENAQDAYFFELEPAEKVTNTESIAVTGQRQIDPYELVVKNQVFKKEQDALFRSLEVEELLYYRYAVASGIDFDVTYRDTIIERQGQPIERIRRETFLGGVRWKGDKQPELPLISPEKVQTAPLVIDLDKSYDYTYLGEDTLQGIKTWKVGFVPKSAGDFFSGTVWIDQQTGAHRRIRAVQSGLEPPVIGNEMDVTFDWVEQNGVRYWTQASEQNLQLINLIGQRINVQISSSRSKHQFNNPATETTLAQAYQGDNVILRDTQEGFRYLKKDSDGKREVSQDTFLKKKALVGGVMLDPALDSPIPLAGFNYTNLNFLGRDLQANFFLAGAVNDLIVSDSNFLGKGWDFTAEAFVSPLYFGDTVYQDGEEREDLEVENLRESLNLTLGIPIGTFWKAGFNYGLGYNAYREADDTTDAYLLPEDHLEHAARFNLEFSRARFASELQLEHVTRGSWSDFGLASDSDEVEKQFTTVRFDTSYFWRLPKFQTLSVEGRYLTGQNLDRFSRFGFGFFENRVSGFGTSGVRGDQAYRLKLEYEVGVKGLFNLGFDLTGAHAELKEPVSIGGYLQPEKVDLGGIGVNVNVMGPWKTIVRFDVGYGVHSSIKAEEGDVSGQIVFLKLF